MIKFPTWHDWNPSPRTAAVEQHSPRKGRYITTKVSGPCLLLSLYAGSARLMMSTDLIMTPRR